MSKLPLHDGLSVTPARAFVSSAESLDLVELVVAGDWLVRLRLIAPGQLVAFAAASHGRGVVLARRAASLVRLRVDSPQETRLRLCLMLAGLPEPETNIVIRTGDGTAGRVDLLFRELRVILEYEGDQHRVDRTQWNLDISRVEAPVRIECALRHARRALRPATARTRGLSNRDRWAAATVRG